MIRIGLDVVRGILIGLANIIPGVSGGTVALVLGIYQRLIHALRSVDIQFVRTSLGILTFKPAAFKRWGEDLKRIDAGFLACIGVGAIGAIGATARFMAFLLSEHREISYGFFFGLVLFSVWVPYRCLKRRSWREVVAFILAATLTVGMTFMVTEEEQIAKEERKQELEETTDHGSSFAKATEDKLQATDDAGLFSLEHPGAGRLVILFLAAALAISAMVLPGVSGSFVLLLLGVYFDVLLAINSREVIVLGTFAAGCIFGLVAFSRLMDVLLNRFFNVTMAFMVGLMTGSLWGLWPFKRIVEVGETTLYLGNVMPEGMDGETTGSLIAFAVGGGLLVVFLVIESVLAKNSGQDTAKKAA